MPADADESKPKDRRLNPSRLPVSEGARALVADVRNQLLNYERYRGPRKRARRANDQTRFDRIVTAIVCEVVHAALGNPEAWRYLSLSKRVPPIEATGAAFMTNERVRIIEWMASPEMDWLEVCKGERGYLGTSRQTAIRASARLLGRMDEHEIQYADLGRDENLMGDPLVLRGPKQRGRAKDLPVPEGEPAETYRDEMRRINHWLAGLDIACDYDSNGNPRDEGDRWLYRIFNDGRMDQGGRLNGGFWQSGMKGKERLRDLTLNGEPVACLDYGQCGIRIAYGLVGAQPPPGDLYAVPGLEGFREGVKKVLHAQLARTKAMTRLPPNTRKHFNQHLSVRDIEDLILRHHHPIRQYFQTGLGLTQQFIESQVLVRCLLQLIDGGLTALPVHDGLYVPQSQIAAVGQVMRECFLSVAGVEAAISVEGWGVDGLPLSQGLLNLPSPSPPSLTSETLGREMLVDDQGGTASGDHQQSTLRSPREGRVSPLAAGA